MTKQRFNTRWALCLVLAFAVLGAGTHLLHGFQVRRNAGILLEQAKQAEQRGDIPKAVDYAYRYVGLAPQDSEGLAKLSLLLADPHMARTQKSVERAYLKLGEALLRDPTRADVRRRAVDLALHPLLHRPWDALEHLNKLPVEQDAELLSLRASCHEVLREYREARADYEAVLQLPKADLGNYLRLASLLREQPGAMLAKDKSSATAEKSTKDVYAKADQTITRMLNEHGGSYRAHLLAAQYYKESFGRTDAAKSQKLVNQHIRKAQELAPDEVDTQLAYAELEQEHKRPEQARAVLEKGLQQHPSEWRLYHALARLEALARRNDVALKVLRDGVHKLPGQVDLQWNLALLLAHQGEVQEASEAIARLAKLGLSRPELDYLEARVEFAQQHWLQAAKLLDRAYPHLLARADQRRDWVAVNLVDECNLLLASCAEQLGDADAAASAYGRALTRSPKSIPARLGLARAEWTLGRLDNAVREYRILMQLPKAPASAWIESAQLMILRNLRRTQPDWNEVEQLLSEAEGIELARIQVGLLRAELLVAKQQYDQARQVLERVHDDKDARPVEVWIGLANLEQRRGRADAALALLSEAEQRWGDQSELRQARCRYWARRGGPEAPRALDQLALGLDKFNGEQRRRMLALLAECYLQIGEDKRAESMWRQVAVQQSNDLSSRLALFDLAMRERRDAAMAALVAEIQRIEGDEGTLWRYCQACRLISQAEKEEGRKGLEAANELLTIVARRRPTWPRVPVAQAQVYDLAGNSDMAIRKYREAVLLGADNPAVIRRAVHLLSSRARYTEADEMIDKLRALSGALGDLDRIQAEIALWKQDSKLALSLAEKAISPDSKDYKDLVWLGQIRWAAGKTSDAEAALRRAIEIEPQAAETWVALVFHLARTKEKDKASKVIAEAAETLTNANLALAQCYEVIGEIDKAKNRFDSALAEAPDDSVVLRNIAYFHLRRNETAEAMKHLERLVGLKGLAPAQLAEARRALTLVFASRGDYQQITKALEHLGVVDGDVEKTSVAGENLADARTKAVVLATAQNPRQRRQAIGVLENLLRQQQLGRSDRLLLARLYESVGEWEKAREQLLGLVTTTQDLLTKQKDAKASLTKDYADQLAALCTVLLRHSATNQAQIWLAKLEEIEPRTFRTLGLRAQVCALQKQPELAVPDLLTLGESDEDLAGRIAVLLEQIGQARPAEEMYKKYVARSKRPESVLTLAEFYGRQNRPDEALALCQSALKTCRIEQVGTAAVAVLYTARATPAQHRQVVSWLDAGIKQNPKATALLTNLAAIRRLQNDLPEVVALYRQVIVNDPNDTLTLNNLAWLLALSDRNGAEALRTIQRAIDLDGPLAEFLDTRGVVYLALKDASKAIRDFEEAIAETPTAHRYFHLAQAHWLAQNRAAATDALQRAAVLKLDDSTVDPLEQPIYRRLITELGVKTAAR